MQYIGVRQHAYHGGCFPKGRIGSAQELQLSTVGEGNVTIYGGEDTISDDGDTIVKGIITNVEFSRKHNLVMLNSFKIGRVLIQSVHYCSSFGDVILMSVHSARTIKYLAAVDMLLLHLRICLQVTVRIHRIGKWWRTA